MLGIIFILIPSFGGRIRITNLVGTEATQFIGKIITVGGWARSVRLADGGNIAFVELNDGSSIKNFQVVVNKEVENFDALVKEGIGSCLQFKGDVVKSPGNKQPVNLYFFSLFYRNFFLISY